MKSIIRKYLRTILMILGVMFLTACAVPKYSYDKEDAGTVFLSLTSNSAMSKPMVNWQIIFEAVDERAFKELPGFGLTVSSRIANRCGLPSEDQFNILQSDKFGNVMQSAKIAPGRYKVRAFAQQDEYVRNNLPVPFELILINETIQDSKWPIITTKNKKQFPHIEFTVEPGKAVYLGSFNAGMFECVQDLGLIQSCKRFEIVIKDEFKRDSHILKDQVMKQANEPKFELVNRVLKIDKSKSPFLYSE